MACELTLPPSGPPKIRPSSIPKNIESTSSPICSACVRNPAACRSKAERSPGLPTACSSVQQLLFRFRKQTHREGAGLAEAGRDVVELRAVRVAGGHVALDVVKQVSRVPVIPPPVQRRAVLSSRFLGLERRRKGSGCTHVGVVVLAHEAAVGAHDEV